MIGSWSNISGAIRQPDKEGIGGKALVFLKRRLSWFDGGKEILNIDMSGQRAATEASQLSGSSALRVFVLSGWSVGYVMVEFVFSNWPHCCWNPSPAY